MVSIQALHNLINTTTHKYIKKYFKKKKIKTQQIQQYTLK